VSDTFETLVTQQSMFDDAVRHLLTQKERAANKFGCVYHDKMTGLKCVLGARARSESDLEGLVNATLSRARYDISIEEAYGEELPCARDNHLEAARARFERIKSVLRVPDDLVDFAIALQLVHDTKPAPSWAYELRLLGLGNALDLAVLDSFNAGGNSA
jgi:hypothetical protein